MRRLDNPQRIQAAGMNVGIRHAHGEILLRMDVHSEYATDYVAACVHELQRTGADNVGGAARARGRSKFQKALCAALQSPLAVGGSGYRSASCEGYVDTVFLGSIPPEDLRDCGDVRPQGRDHEDAELNQRIIAAGGRVYLSTRVEAYYYPRESLRRLGVQYFRYGMGRARTILKHGLPRREGKRVWRPLGPMMLVAGTAALSASPPLYPLLAMGAAGLLGRAPCGVVSGGEGRYSDCGSPDCHHACRAWVGRSVRVREVSLASGLDTAGVAPCGRRSVPSSAMWNGPRIRTVSARCKFRSRSVRIRSNFPCLNPRRP